MSYKSNADRYELRLRDRVLLTFDWTQDQFGESITHVAALDPESVSLLPPKLMLDQADRTGGRASLLPRVS